ncbi:hypothetical protein A2858_00620 [Candidatus Daviesbacteria bacterium RIFCSPHIGHO2_01_FULL_36_37]|uniref:Prepilin peptidase n=2 Tax=Candidatus Daviesiibacteriota TaxID=1752718 RepID=A0A1F5K596_9BACT|nr:MAG: hypothetical protein A2858_00620 [Candidatus Daviesbacteria bacterium RIFCSPHIGHO2_01_FULL_36_37]OGE35974.1 MAG: hypothetical protein A3E66_01615 [Candidatus Daviesbacteria bacterium RIFCSPHIGHO2_12_FULL_37_16]
MGLGLLFGLLLGSLAKALADRSVSNKSFWGRSYCESCKHKLSWYDLFPILSFVFTQGKCRYCQKKISFEYPLVEIITGILISILFYFYLPTNFLTLPVFPLTILVFDLIFKAFVIVVLVIVLITDIKEGLIPDRITYPAIVITFFYLLFISSVKIYMLYYSTINSSIGLYLLPPQSDYYLRHAQDIIVPFLQNILTSLGIGLFFLSLILATKGRGMGGGDMKLGVFIGLVLGFPLAVISLMLGFLTGAIVGILLLIIGKKKFGQTIPFGPFLSLGAILTIFWGEKILNWYINLKLG